ncbi:hypothetical protein RHMOL_Rhmol05G0286200 [Rhododendron molle]|uniref:Uncharacterized protein n=1 Tax=Rhododendron molle TaxID=49168 RepID=A0ACC0NVD0_RHOML|nr:hypothetical protein RHMOL_Rhmol05G0286200 [Rhododendron molle]
MVKTQLGELWNHLRSRNCGEEKEKMLGLFAIICWNVWKGRNGWLFKKTWLEETKIIVFTKIIANALAIR